MKNVRRGMGFGRGIGYYNIAPMDSHIHRLSAKGVKTYQKGSMPIQNTASIKATAMVGDGKTPNKYFVTIGEDYYYYDEETGSYNWVSDKYSGYDFKGKTMKVFDTYEEAKEYADSLALNSLVDGVKVKCVQIEDRLTGQVYERTQKEEGGVLESSDIKFTKDTEAKKGVKSTIAKTRPKENPVNSKNLVNYIMEFEGGNPTSEDTMHLFSYLIKTGQAWTLQGMYGRTAKAMIDAGYLDKQGNILKELNLNAKGMAMYTPNKRVLMDEEGNEFSANAGDYWNLKPDQELKGLTLIENGKVIKEHPTKKDLVDEIYQAQGWQTKFLKSRTSLPKGKLYRITTEDGKDYIVNNKGLITQEYRYRKNPKDFSGQWALEGASDMYGRKVADWDELLKSPDTYLKTRGGLHIIDLDNGTTRTWGNKIRSVKDASYLKHLGKIGE